MFKKEQIKMKNENGEEKVYDIILSFDNEETGKTYIVYTENKEDENGNLELYASKYNPEEEHPKFEKIETEREWQIVDIVVKSVQEELKFS